MTTLIRETERELADDIRRAWDAYRETIAALSGETYEQVEQESWVLLQAELRRVERRRRMLSSL